MVANGVIVTGPDASGRREGVLTPMGFVPLAGMEALSAFGQEADRLQYPCIDVGGFIVPGRDPAAPYQPGVEGGNNAPVAGEGDRTEGRQAPGPWQGEGAPSAQAAPGEAPHAVRHGLTHTSLDLSGLVDFHPLTRVVAKTERFAYLNIPIGLLRELPFRTRVTLEIPLLGRVHLSRPGTMPTPVPDIRAWAVWDGGPNHGQLLLSHHKYPDHAICACMPAEWLLGRDALRDYVAFCALWAAKLLHEQLLDRYPGLQHYPAVDRVRRDRKDEYCGCGAARRYAACCRDVDQRTPPYVRWREARQARDHYLRELAWQRRSAEPPYHLLGLGLPRNTFVCDNRMS